MADPAPALDAAFGPGRVRAGLLLQAGPSARVFEGVEDGRPVIVKWFLGPEAPARVARLAADHAALPPGARVAAWRRAEAQAGLVVQDRAPGERLDAVLARPGERGRALALAGEWLAEFGAASRRDAPWHPHRVLRRRREAMPPDLPRPDAALTRAVLPAMREVAAGLRGQSMAQARLHGDFSPYNLHLAGGEVWAFDLSPARVAPVAVDAAHFLVLAGLRWPVPGPLRDGLPRADRAALLAALPGVEGPALRLMIGDRLLRALHEARGAPDRIAAARAALIHWLEAAP